MSHRIPLLCLLLCLLIPGPAAVATLDCPLRCSQIILSAEGVPGGAILIHGDQENSLTVSRGTVIDNHWLVTEINRDSVLLRDTRSGQITRLSLAPQSRTVTVPQRNVPPARINRDPRGGRRQIVAPERVEPAAPQTVQPSFTFGLPGDEEKKQQPDYRWPAGR